MATKQAKGQQKTTSLTKQWDALEQKIQELKRTRRQASADEKGRLTAQIEEQEQQQDAIEQELEQWKIELQRCAAEEQPENKYGSYSGPTKLKVCQKLVKDWSDLADVLDIPISERARFEKGREPQEVWEWLEQHGRIGELPAALKAINRDDLVALFDADTPETQQAPEALRRSYLNWVLNECGMVPLTAVDQQFKASEAEARFNLDALYTGLWTLTAEQQERDVMLRDDDRQGRRMSALEQLNQHQYLVLLGDPGSGKSTFVNFVAMCLAGEALRNPTANLNLLTAPLPKDDGEDDEQRQTWQFPDILPVRVILREFAARGLPDGQPGRAKHLMEFMIKELEDATLGQFAGYLQEHLRSQGGLLLLDGLDEVSDVDQRRAQVKDAIEEFAGLFCPCRVVVTSRTYAYQEQQWQLRGFAEARLAPFSAGQIRRFIQRWYLYIGKLRRESEEKSRNEARDLQNEIFRSANLRELAERPLLLTLMTSLHASRVGGLPQKRVELYRETVDLLLDRWERRKFEHTDAQGRPVTEYESLAAWLKVDKAALLRSLAELAYQAHASQTEEQKRTADIPQEKLAGALLTISPIRTLPHQLLLDHLSYRAGILIPSRREQCYTFPHRSFQEYLAACYFTNGNFPSNITELARNDPNRWREVVLLAGAKAASGTTASLWSLVEYLCTQPVKERENLAEDAWGALFGAQALVETECHTQVDPCQRDKFDRIRHWLVAILTEHVTLSEVEGQPFPATERALAGNILAVLGDPRPGVGCIPLLGGVRGGLPDIAWITIPTGTFLMGSDPKQDKQAWNWEYPQHEVDVPEFQISRYPVTNAQYRAFIADGGYTEQWRECWTEEGWEWRTKNSITEPDWFGGVFDLPNHPVVCVSWYEAKAFCAWLTAKPGHQCPGSNLKQAEARSQDARNSHDSQDAAASFSFEPGALAPGDRTWLIRLPSEAEWEKAARWDETTHTSRIYPWGDNPDPEYANYDDTGLGATSAVGCFLRGASFYGCEEMAGNVWEWCEDVWHDNYKGAPDDGSAWLGDGSKRVDRGGSWDYTAGSVRCAFRHFTTPRYRYLHLGFRLARIYQ